MKFIRSVLLTAAGATAAASAASAQLVTKVDKPGSAYVQCDGQPNNVTGGETAARLLGAVTLLGLFAPAPEAADASKRKTGAEGVAVCTGLIEGEKKEGNASRRLGLILGRAIHRIEAKQYDAAIADVALARGEAEAGGFMADPYFARSRGRSFDLIEGAALLRMGRRAEAQQASLRGSGVLEHSMFGLLTTPNYAEVVRPVTEVEERYMQARTRVLPWAGALHADRLEIAGRFADAARIRDALVEIDRVNSPAIDGSLIIAQAAVAHALAGNAELAATRAAEATANAAKRKSDGKPETDAAEFVELMDLYGIVKSASAGEVKTARRLFSARSQWVGASLGSVMEVNRRLRLGAASDELIGGLVSDSEQLWKERADAKLAELLAKDADNKTLFYLVHPLQPASAYEAMSKAVWNTEKSKFLLKSKKIDPDASKMETLFFVGAAPRVAMDAYVMHAALLARARGHQGFIFMPLLTDQIAAGSIRTGNRGEPGLPAEFFLDAETVITRNSALFPSPEALKARQAKARQTAKN